MSLVKYACIFNGNFNGELARKDILEQIVHGNVHPTVNLTHVYTQTDRVLLVLQVIRVIIVPQVILSQFICISQIGL